MIYEYFKFLVCGEVINKLQHEHEIQCKLFFVKIAIARSTCIILLPFKMLNYNIRFLIKPESE